MSLGLSMPEREVIYPTDNDHNFKFGAKQHKFESVTKSQFIQFLTGILNILESSELSCK